MRPRTRSVTLAVLLACACASSACLVLTLQPIYDDGSLESDEGLPGTWVSEEQPATVTVERGEWKSYRLTYTSRSTSYALVGYLARVGDATFLDLTPAQGLEAGPLVIPAHGICRLRRDGDSLTVAALDYEWFAAARGSKKVEGLEMAMDLRQNLLLASKTSTLRAWLQAHLKTADAFREPVTFTRSK